VKLSVIIPVYNEVENIDEMHAALRGALAAFDHELILVDDGSSDGTVERLEALAEQDREHTVVVEFRRNFGQTAAIAAGIDHASGEVIVLIDADLQEDPADIPMLVAKIEEGYDVVSGWRKERKDAFLTRTLPSRIANALISRVTGVRLHDYGCTLKAFRLYGEMHRFIPAYAGGVGARIIEVPVTHRPRLRGKAKYGLERTFKVILDLFTVKFLISYANKPIYLFGGLGFLLGLASVGVLGMLGVRRVLYDEHLVRSPLLLLVVMLFILGMQSIMMGLIAELLARTYHESQAKLTYTIRRVLNRPGPST
jgi:glycosyltransferase involved in cell wall biosynthesis